MMKFLSKLEVTAVIDQQVTDILLNIVVAVVVEQQKLPQAWSVFCISRRCTNNL